MKSYQDYIHFQTEDFLADLLFKEWLANPTPEMNAYWQGLVRTHPHLEGSFMQARLIGLGMASSWTSFSEEYVDRLFSRVQQAAPADTGRVPGWLSRRTWQVAASVTALLIACAWAVRFYLMAQTIHTGYGELKDVKLYDGSLVTLNANSTLNLPSRFAWQTKREVWLNGEAYFTVRKQPAGDGHTYRKFTVHTHRVDVTVLGTRFNIYTRPQKTQVLLDEGRVELDRRGHEPPVLMRPGQFVEYGGQQKNNAVIKTIPAAQSRQVNAWKRNLLIFNDAGMTELARRFSEIYGVSLILEGDAFADQQFTGELPVNDLEKSLLIISKTFDMQAVKDGQRVYFTNNTEVP